ncbi:MAG: DUF1289 domain-containing protein [Ottowia sp.]|jgi:predicted Fe-S protein YdhL (DUF1289 family)|nr:DUF1289 domain-containing protein [Ottowia sp.]
MNNEAAYAGKSGAGGPFDSDNAAQVASPCTGVCRLHPTTGWCEGCWRSLDEIAGWSSMNAPQRRDVLARTAQRREGTGNQEGT